MGRYPAVSAAIACSLGIVVDRYSPLAESLLFVAAVVLVLVWLAIRNRHAASATAAVLVLCSVIAALHHHLWWHHVPEADISRFVGNERSLVRLQGTVASKPEVIPADVASNTSFAREDVTRLELVCRSALLQNQWTPITGLIRVTVRQDATSLHIGDQVILSGWLSDLPSVRNPGGMDFKELMRRRRVRAMLYVQDPKLITVTHSGATWFSRLRRTVRDRCERVLDAGLSDRTRGIGLAMLLGNRTRIAPDVKTAFIVSGTVHILAISGLHVGILALFLLGSARVCGLSERATFVCVVLSLTAYLVVADLRPPMVRAYVLIVVWCVSRLARRAPVSANSLAVSALIILVMNPTDLFAVGAQLSFLAVAAIYWLSAERMLEPEPDDVAVAPDSPKGKAALRPNWMNLLIEWAQVPRQWWKVAGSIWLLGLPLVVHAWHVIPLVGLAINSLLLIPLVALGLWAGFLAIVIGNIWLTPGVFIASGFDIALRLLLFIVDLAARLPFGHLHVSGLPLWALLVLYAIAAAAMLLTLRRRRSPLFWAGAILWAMFGCSIGVPRVPPQVLKCTVLSVGHGLSVVVEAPTGETLLYDVGSQLGGETAARIVEGAFWKEHVTSINALVVSHADFDHYGGVRPLLRSMSVERLYVSPQFRNPDEPLTVRTLEAAEILGIRVVELRRDRAIPFAPDVTVKVLHPDDAASYESDNAESVVLQIDYAGRRILLTGDLRDDGLTELLKQTPRQVDFLLSPHHGDPLANSSALADWASPSVVVASARRGFDSGYLKSVYGHDTQVLSTSESGAVEFVISPDGAISHAAFIQ